jgi:S1-C subfamily serine protease
MSNRPETAAEVVETGADRRASRSLVRRPLVWAVAAALVATAAFLLGDRGSSGSNQAAPPAASTTTTLPRPIGQVVYRTIQPSLVIVQTTDADGGSSLGSGVVFDKQGEILTANHVISDATSITVTFADGTASPADVSDSDPDHDTAVLTPVQLPTVVVPAVLAGGVNVGDDIYSVGNPLGLTDSITAGVVSATDRSIPREDGSGTLDGLIQFDAAVNPGSSGGPLLNARGQVVGIVTALANPSGQRFFVGVGFAVPIASAGGGGRLPPT